MTHTTAQGSYQEKQGWGDTAKAWLRRAAIAGVFFLAGLYIVAPMIAARQPSHLPSAFLALPTGAVEIANPESAGALLPVRVAATTQARSQSFRGVGESAMDNQFVLYTLTRATTSRATYATEGFGAPVDFAVIDGEGAVVAVHRGTPGSQRVSVPEPHRWVLVAKAGALERIGVDVGSAIDPDSIRTF